MATTSEKLAELLFDVFTESASEQSMHKLTDILHTFKTSHYRAYNNVRQQPFAAHLIEALEEAVDFHKSLADINAECDAQDLEEERRFFEKHNAVTMSGG
jgi:hypothetical protein